MFVFKTLPQIVIKNNCLNSSRSIFTQFILSTKYSSSELSSPIKNVVKKRRKISSSSEEEAPVAKKISNLKKSPKEENISPKKSPKAKTSTTEIIKTESPENKPQNGQSSTTTSESPTVSNMNFLKIQSADTKGCDFNPGKKNYHPINDAFWKKGEK